MPYDVVHVLNRYFKEVGGPITANGGYVSDYEGDGLMAVFPADDPRTGALGAVRAGLEMLRAVERLAEYLDRLFGRSFRIGIGVHCGNVVVGEIALGDTRRMAAIGHTVNVANRIEQATKDVGTSFLISAETLELVAGRVLVNRTATVELPGNGGRHTVHEVVGLAEPDGAS
jgi:adenylate cyclase